MKNKLLVLGSLAISMLVYNCSVSKDTNQSVNTNPKRIFNPTPTSEYLSPKQSLKTFNLPKGYHLELVASEPMIKEPVAIAWDGNAKMYVAEMLTYMQDADATGERVPRSRISLLEDTNNDGKMDKSTVFIDNLLLPRMILCVNHELLVNETNTITVTAYKDTDGDGKADKKRIVFENAKYSNANNMEHQRSGLDWNLDNYIYMTYEPTRFKYSNGMLKADTMANGSPGQWGITHDNYGRLFYSSAGGEVPIQRFQINPAYGSLNLKDQYSNEFAAVWPIISTPDVQGGLSRLRPDSTLNRFTASCGQSIFRGNSLPKDLVGDYLVCEPVGRLIRRAKLTNVKGKYIAENAYFQQEFIASSDMNFRPINTYTGPDGNLYIVDMHRGIIQQGSWTKPGSFLRKVIDRMGFANNIGHGRIYRMVHDGFKSTPKPRLLDESPAQLVTYLDHPNGWWRDNAQKQLIILGDRSVVPALKQIAQGNQGTLSAKPSHLGRIHALWTLEGLNAIDKDILLKAMNDQDAQVRKAAIWISEPFIKKNDAQIVNKLAELKTDSSYDVRMQLLLSLSYNKGEKAKSVVNDLMAQNQDNEIFVATAAVLEKNDNIKMYGNKLANLSAGNRTSVLQGASIFRSICAGCHGGDGKGLATAIAPPLVGSKRLFGDKYTAINILLHGLTGPIEGKTYPDNLMPAMGANSDEWVANVLSYVRFELASGSNNGASSSSPFISSTEVKMVRDESGTRTKSWTIAELEMKTLPK
jgi:putative membrane-bound dehydrogenase-like protein